MPTRAGTKAQIRCKWDDMHAAMLIWEHRVHQAGHGCRGTDELVVTIPVIGPRTGRIIFRQGQVVFGIADVSMTHSHQRRTPYLAA